MKEDFNKLIKKQSKKDWHILEFCMPIQETTSVDNDFLIKGTAINETTTRNGIKYIAKELEKAAPSFRSKPILLDHENSVRNIVGRTTENVNFNPMKGSIEFEAKIMDKEIQNMINDGRITDVSIGASVEDLEEGEDGTVTALGLEGLELSLVAVPGDPGANIANALAESFKMKKEILMAGKEPSNYLSDLEGGNDKMAEEEQTQQEETPEEPAEETAEEKPEEDTETEEKLKVAIKRIAELEKSVRLDAVKEYSKVAERKKKKVLDTSKMTIEMVKVLIEQLEGEEEPKEESTPPAEEPKEEKTEEAEDETKGAVGTESEEDEVAEESAVIEKAETGRGFQIWRDYSKEDAGKFKRLSR